jgi:type IV pilus assembly protein PilE
MSGPRKPKSPPIIGRRQPFVENQLNLPATLRMLEPDGGITMLLPPRRTAGFTLIELMIVVAILGILSAVAYPSYQNYIRKSRRADAHAMLQAAQLAQEKYRINHTNYYPGGAASGSGTTIAEFSGVCIVSGTTCLSPDRYYSLTSTTTVAGQGTSYTLTATAVSGTTQDKDTGCKKIAVVQTAGTIVYGGDDTNGTTPSNKCWNK